VGKGLLTEAGEPQTEVSLRLKERLDEERPKSPRLPTEDGSVLDRGEAPDSKDRRDGVKGGHGCSKLREGSREERIRRTAGRPGVEARERKIWSQGSTAADLAGRTMPYRKHEELKANEERANRVKKAQSPAKRKEVARKSSAARVPNGFTS